MGAIGEWLTFTQRFARARHQAKYPTIRILLNPNVSLMNEELPRFAKDETTG